MKSEIYKDHYEFEWEHRAYLASALNLPLGVVTVLGGAVALMIRGFPYDDTKWTIAFLCPICLASLFLCVAAYYLFSAFSGYHYKRIPTPRALKKHYDCLRVWNEEHAPDEDTESVFAEELNERLAEATEVNATNNKRRSAFLYRCNAALGISVVLMALASIPYISQTVKSEDKTHHVKLVAPISINPREGLMHEYQEPEKDEAPKEPPSRPVMPPNEDIKEHVVPPSDHPPVDKGTEG